MKPSSRLLSSVAVAGLCVALGAGAGQAQLLGGGLPGGLGDIARETTQQVQWAFQAADRALALARQAEQIRNELDMLRMGRFAAGDAIRQAIREARGLSISVERVLWRVGAVNADFEALYPPALPSGMTLAALSAHRLEQEWLLREASRNSKISSSGLMGNMRGVADRAQALLAASKDCAGQTCAIDIAAQTAALGAETQAQHLMLSATHGRAVEGLLDFVAAGPERARQFQRQFRRGLPSAGVASPSPGGAPPVS